MTNPYEGHQPYDHLYEVAHSELAEIFNSSNLDETDRSLMVQSWMLGVKWAAIRQNEKAVKE